MELKIGDRLKIAWTDWLQEVDDGALDRAYAKLGATANEEPREIKAKYRKLIATAHPDRNPDADVAEFNAIKDAYELIVGKDCGGASFEGLGSNRDFIAFRRHARLRHTLAPPGKTRWNSTKKQSCSP